MRKNENQHAPETNLLMAKYRKQLFLTTVSAVVSIGVIVGATAAWFASNRRVDSTGMQAQVQISSNLIIADTPSNLKLNPSPTVQFDAQPLSLKPCRHIGDGVGPDQAEGTNLYYNTNPENVDLEDGLAGAGALTFSAVPVADADEYYCDFNVYISAIGGRITANQLTVSMSTDPAGDTNINKHLNAATIDVYIASDYYTNTTGKQTISDGTNAYVYAGTINAAGKDWATSDDLTDLVSLDIDSDIIFPDVSKPQANDHRYPDPDGSSSDTYPCVPVILRCYFDGGLLEDKDAKKAYINSAETTDSVKCNMSISFVATEPQQ